MFSLTERFTRHLPPAAYIRRATAFLFGALLGLIPGLPASAGSDPLAANLKPATASAFDEYVKLTQARNDAELQRGTNLLWIDSLPDGERARANEALKIGRAHV